LEHITARQHGGLTEEKNLAWACHRCNRHKGPNLTGIDPDTHQIVLLFHPRIHYWNEHFKVAEFQVVGETAIGRATAASSNECGASLGAQSRVDSISKP
jgi:hypothetical protein